MERIIFKTNKFRERLAGYYFFEIQNLYELINKTENVELQNFYHYEISVFRILKLISYGFENLSEEDQTTVKTEYTTLFTNYTERALILSTHVNENHYLEKIALIDSDYYTFKLFLLSKPTVQEGFLNFMKTTKLKEKMDIIADLEIPLPEYILNY